MEENGIVLSDDVIIEIVHGIRDVLLELVRCLRRTNNNKDMYSELYFQNTLRRE